MSARRTIAAALAVPALLGLSACGSDEPDALSASQRSTVVRVATDHLESLLSYDADSLPTDRREVARLATGEFARQYRALLGGSAAERITALKASSVAEVVDAGVERSDPAHPVVLAYLRQTTSVSGAARPTVALTAVEATLRRVDGGWRVQRLEPIDGGDR